MTATTALNQLEANIKDIQKIIFKAAWEQLAVNPTDFQADNHQLGVCHSQIFHGAYSTAPEHLKKYHGKDGFFIKKFLISDKRNLNGWRVTWESMKKDIKTFIGQPVVLTPDKDHPPTQIQDHYKVGEIIDVGLDELTHSAWQVSEITDKKAQDMILAEKVKFGSPTVHGPKAHLVTTHAGTSAEENTLHRFIGKHDALVAEPAYTRLKDVIKVVCQGDGGQCLNDLVEVEAEINDTAISQITIIPAVKKILEAHYNAETVTKIMMGIEQSLKH